MSIEKDISHLRINTPTGLHQLVDFANTVDSDSFCTAYFDVYHSSPYEKVEISLNAESKLKKIWREAYQLQLNTVIAACTAASDENLEKLQGLQSLGFNLALGDYDRRTPLHLAAFNGKLKAVKYLVEEGGVDVNPLDRWGATPLNDAQSNMAISEYLKSKGGKEGKSQPRARTNITDDVPQDQYRLFYAAYYGDVAMMNNLRMLGWDVNGQDYDGRTALGIAASEGHLEAVKYLIKKGADLSLRDQRGNDPLDDAIREGRDEVVEYLINEALVRNYCHEFEDGLLKNGISQVFGVFLKKFEDLDIAIESVKNKTSLIELLSSDELLPQKSYWNAYPGLIRTFEVFMATQELYIYKVISMMIDMLQASYESYGESYKSLAQKAFFIFLTLQIIAMFILRKKLVWLMCDDIQQSKSILNLVPDQFFMENQQGVEKIIRALQD
ncbi:hypothetical protein FGO68_gene16169 [Halteria grandinella]|uniref:Ankyrin repeat domain-containing protein n=1 Tax=Halteria grandinella TaxID=5974 RepID=A0A8J8TB06_HALGN|nr:hypothetical protein FGO68_gene16169 [Halteria grandinella]